MEGVAAGMKIKIHAAGRKILEAEAPEVVLPGADGEFSVLDFHQPCLYSLRMGRIRVKYGGHRSQVRGQRSEEKVSIKKGVAKVTGNELVVLAEV